MLKFGILPGTLSPMQAGSKTHEQVVVCKDKAAGLNAVIAIHSTKLGPALGGVRMFPYPNEEAALKDVLRLSEAMTYKAAAAGLPLGGGKSVIVGNPAQDKSPALFQALGRFIQNLKGRYIAAEDSGTNENDMAAIAAQTKFVSGTPRTNGTRGDASEATALGVYLSMQVAFSQVCGRESLRDAHIAVLGVGSVGVEICKLLFDAKARLTVADINAARAQRARDLFGAQIAEPQTIHRLDCDIFSPCALGGILNDATIPEIRAKCIVGAANNQLLDGAKHSALLHERGILYAPDYVVNAGGIIKLYLDIKDAQAPGARVEQIADTLRNVFARAQEQNCSPEEAASQLARQRLQS